jgi:hypothetical protein
MPVVLLAELNSCKRNNFFIMSSSLKVEIPTIIKTIPNGIVPNFLNFHDMKLFCL